ncbi:Astacin-like metalloendopeptidase [Camponotus floridanus]|uniref:Metalloendopeptidase n=1 Tax=Camponotus floridanus TaxID=104421 RepID=E2AUQ5_CAMFO|nr:Astacin-like metalloendopeptidase [Camponotus floridanus]
MTPCLLHLILLRSKLRYFVNLVTLAEDALKHLIDQSVRTLNQDQEQDLLLYLYESSQDPEVRPGLFEGDIAMTNEYLNYWRIGLRWDVFPDKLWQNGIVPYVISDLYNPADYVKIYKAITYINNMTCVKFIPWDGKSKDFLLIWPMMNPKGCWSFVGKFGGAQILSLEPPDEKGPNCLENEGRAIHELMHALGIFHEHSRADRDMYIDIHYENIIPGFRSNFNKQSPENATYSYEYGYDSIMHYGNYFFSIDPMKPTLTPKMPGVMIGQRTAMSKTDCLKLNNLYGCLNKPEEAGIYHNICKTWGL